MDRARRWLEPWTGRRIWVFWLVTRVALVVLAITAKVLGAQHGVLGDVRLYDQWGDGLLHGRGLPVGDDRWQYPPAAAIVLVVPSVLEAATGFPYDVGFFLLILASDAAITGILARRSASAVRFWLVGICALGPVSMARFDMVPAVLAVTAVAGLGGSTPSGPTPSGPTPSGPNRYSCGRWGRVGLAVGLGTAVKVWPVLLLLALGGSGAGIRLAGRLRGCSGEPSGRPADSAAHLALVRMAAGLVGAVVLVAGVLFAAGWWRDAFGFLGAQKARGLQVEAVSATPFVLAHMVGLHAGPSYAWGALQFGSKLAQLVATICSFVEVVVVLAAAARWWLPRSSRRPEESRATAESRAAIDPADRMLALLLVVLVTSRVLSPQYLVWVLAVAACRRYSSGQAVAAARRMVDSRRRVTIGLLATCLLSFVVYPIRYEDVIQGRVVASLLLVARNGLLLIVCWDAVRAAWLPSRSGPWPPWQSWRRPRSGPQQRPAPRLRADADSVASRSEPATPTTSHTASPK
nr:glycosyltransferase 87 family protein [Frankia sp. Cr2]